MCEDESTVPTTQMGQFKVLNANLPNFKFEFKPPKSTTSESNKENEPVKFSFKPVNPDAFKMKSDQLVKNNLMKEQIKTFSYNLADRSGDLGAESPFLTKPATTTKAPLVEANTLNSAEILNRQKEDKEEQP